LKNIFILAHVLFSLLCKSQTDIKAHGQNILDGKIKASDDNPTFRILDSLCCKNIRDRDFYFKVANKIRQQSDGALSEYFSGASGKFYLTCNSDFLRLSRTISNAEVNNWLDFIAFDFYVDAKYDSDIEKVKAALNKLSTNHKLSSGEANALRKKYNNYIINKTEIYLKD
jgi:hypothetical protein